MSEEHEQVKSPLEALEEIREIIGDVFDKVDVIQYSNDLRQGDFEMKEKEQG
jgi:hypothetical protein